MAQTYQKYLAEFLGTAIIVATVLGAGHMVGLLGADPTLGLFVIAITVGMVLFAVISMLISISGAQFNPIVSLAFMVRRELSVRQGLSYMLFQVLGAVSGAMVANLMFEKPALVSGVVERISAGAFLGEVVASAGLLLIILMLVDQGKLNLIAVSVGCWIAAGHVFTSSTSFANPAVTLGRSLSDAASGIAAASVPGYVAAQLVGAAIAIFLASALKQRKAANV